MSEELWADIPGYEGFYQASNLGAIRSVSRRVACRGGYRSVTPRLLKRSFDKDGYPIVSVSTGSRSSSKTAKVHRLVMLAFVGPLPDGLETRHLNDVKSDCSLINLVYGSGIENWADRKSNGNGIDGDKNPNWKGGINVSIS